MLLVTESNFKAWYILSSKLLEMYGNQSFSLDDESIRTTGAQTHKFDLYSDFYLIKFFLCFVLLTLSIFYTQNLILKLFGKWIAPSFCICTLMVFLCLKISLASSFSSSKLMLIFLSRTVNYVFWVYYSRSLVSHLPSLV